MCVCVFNNLHIDLTQRSRDVLKTTDNKINGPKVALVITDIQIMMMMIMMRECVCVCVFCVVSYGSAVTGDALVFAIWRFESVFKF